MIAATATMTVIAVILATGLAAPTLGMAPKAIKMERLNALLTPLQ
jgi:hypothetical protein